MCRLFGLHAGAAAAPAALWLLDAPDSLAAQSHRNPDGAGIGVFGVDGAPTVDKQPIAAWNDTAFASGARELHGTTFVAHVRHASTGAHTIDNTHPFEQDGRLLADNGVVESLDVLEARLAEMEVSGLVSGETDSERVFALITAETAARDGDVTAGLVAAISWIGAHLPVYSLNIVLTTATDLWALRCPAANELWVLPRPDGGAGASQGPDARTDRIHARSQALAGHPSVIIASEPMDDEPGWRLMDFGELLHVGADLVLDSSAPFPDQPARQLDMSDLVGPAAASQQATP